MPNRIKVETHPLTPDRWRDFAALMKSRYDTRHCWCMWPRLATSYSTRPAAANRRAIKKVVDTAAAPPGVLAYVDGAPVGWCAVAPREEYPRLARSRATAPVDDEPAWSVVCFYVLRSMRHRGLQRTLLDAAVKLATAHGARTVEGYPVEGTRNLFRGMTHVFEGAGFSEAARRSPNRPIMRYRAPASAPAARRGDAGRRPGRVRR
jgi:GNAT superfamily N-acetyltransferase